MALSNTGGKKRYKVGIPRALHYYRYYPFWKKLLEELDAEIVLSPPTNKKIVEEELKIPPGTQSDTIFRFKKRGVPHLYDKGRGDHYIRIIVEIPKSISEEQKQLLRKYKELEKP